MYATAHYTFKIHTSHSGYPCVDVNLYCVTNRCYFHYKSTLPSFCTMDSTESLELTPIQKFYSGTKILITGASGFFGSILLEKLLRSCPDVSTIYILVRQKRENDSETRAKKIMDQVIFQRLKAEQPNFIEKVVGISGDCTLPNLGLNPQTMEMLKKEVDIVFHLAATVNLTGDLKRATFINMRATRDLISLAREMPNLKVFMHVSSAYSNAPLNVIEEKMYPPAFDANAMITIAEHLPNSTLEKISDILVGQYRNTYSFTKQMAETIIEKNGVDLPIGIHRPSIAISTYKEPIRSWINSMNSAAGLIAFANLGILRTALGGGSFKSAPIPVDMCMNSLIAVAWDTAAAYQRAKTEHHQYELPIYHYESGSVNPISWKQCIEKSYYNSESRSIWFPFCIFHNNVYVYKLYRFLLHILPALFMDLVAIALAKTPKMTNMYSKIHKLNEAMSNFSTKQWIFKSSNVSQMIEKMSDRDREIFFCDLRQLDWDDFFKTYMEGIKLYLLKDKTRTISKQDQKEKREYVTQLCIFAIIGIILSLLLWFLEG